MKKPAKDFKIDERAITPLGWIMYRIDVPKYYKSKKHLPFSIAGCGIVYFHKDKLLETV